MVWVRKIFGFILVAMALYFARHIIGGRATMFGYIVTAFVAGIYLGWLDRTPVSGRGFAALKRAVGIAGIAIACLLLILPAGPLRRTPDVAGIDWAAYGENELRAAMDAGMPVMIDFTADWCIPCHELDHKTFSAAPVRALAERTVAMRVDLTMPGERERAIKEAYDIRGVPTVVFIDGSGNELKDLRVTGYVGPDDFTRRLERLLER